MKIEGNIPKSSSLFCSTLDSKAFSLCQAVPTMVLAPTGWLQWLQLQGSGYSKYTCSLIPGGQVVANLWISKSEAYSANFLFSIPMCKIFGTVSLS